MQYLKSVIKTYNLIRPFRFKLSSTKKKKKKLHKPWQKRFCVAQLFKFRNSRETIPGQWYIYYMKIGEIHLKQKKYIYIVCCLRSLSFIRCIVIFRFKDYIRWIVATSTHLRDDSTLRNLCAQILSPCFDSLFVRRLLARPLELQEIKRRTNNQRRSKIKQLTLGFR